MDLDNRINLERTFRDNPQLASSIHKGKNVDDDFNKLAELTKIPLNFLLTHHSYIKRLVFEI